MRLLGEANVPVSGVIMLSAYFDWSQKLPGHDVGYIGLLPSYASTAQFFGLVGQGVDEDEWFDQAAEFAATEYAAGLFAGDQLSPAAQADLAQKVAGYIGISPEFLLARHNRIELEDFRRELLADRGLIVGRLDMRFAETSLLSVQNSNFYFACEDPANHAVDSAWYAAFRDFLRNDVGYRAPAAYRMSVWSEIGIGWNWVHKSPGTDELSEAPNLAFDIASAMRRSPSTRLIILGGRYDAATPWWNMQHTMSQLYLPEELKRNISYKRYGAGHMAYVYEPALMQMAADMEEFYAQ